MGAETDDALWSRSLQGDGSAFGVLFDRHGDRVFRHARALTTTRQDAEDVVAVAFLELWRRRREVRLVNGSPLPWLLVTATRAGLNNSRGTRRYRALLSRLPRDTPERDPADVLADAGALGIDERLRLALSGLGETDRRLLALVVLDGYSLTASAQRLGLTVGAAKSRMHRTRIRMRSGVAEGPHGAPGSGGLR